MKVIIVEPEKQVIKQVMRVLHAIDSSIVILAVVNDVETLQQRITMPALPDLVLINRELLADTRNTIEAKLIITTSKNHLVYFAFRISHLKYLQKYLLKEKTAGQPDPKQRNAVVKNTGIDQTFTVPVLQQAVKKRFLVTYQQKLLSVAVEEIAYFFSDNRFIFFKTFDNRKFLVEYRMDELETILDRQLFFRINRSYIISINCITVIYTYPGNRYKINLTPAVEKEMIVSRERIANFKKWLGE
jgi:two-component system response regulator LytT